MAHRFDPAKMKKLDSPERRKELPPEELLEYAGLKSGGHVADIGCGIGYFSIPAAEIVGPGGHVHAVDVSEEMLDELKRRMPARIKNLTTHLSDGEKLPLENKLVDFVFLCNVYHEIPESDRFLEEIYRVLPVKGKCAIVDWQKKETGKGPPLEHRISMETVMEDLENRGFNLLKNEEIYLYYYLVTAVKI